jgi:hypothetical protein
MTSTNACLTDRQRSAAYQVLSRIRGRFDLAFFSGSLIAGLGHATSDVDVHVVLPDGAQLDRLLYEVDDQSVQLTPLSRSRLRRIAEAGGRLSATSVDRAQFELDDASLWQLMRTANGVLVDDPEGPDRSRSAGHAEALALFGSVDRGVVRQVLMGNFAHPVARLAKDAFGLIGSGDVRSAYTCGVQAVDKAIELGLASGDDLYPILKFKFARLARGVLAPCQDALWRLMYVGAAEPTAADVERRLWAAGGIVAAGLLDGWDSALRTVPVLDWTDGGARRSPYWSLMRFVDGFALAGPDRSLRVAEPVARLWYLLDGRPYDALVRAFGSTAEARVRQAVTTLVDAGAVVEPVGRVGQDA